MQHKPKESVFLKKMSIQNFKNIEDTVIEFGNHTEIHGKNAMGKTAVIEALEQCFFPSKRNNDKIRIGCDKAIVKAELRSPDDQKVITVKSVLKKDDNPVQTVKFDGIEPQHPRAFLKQFVTVETFSPSKIIAKEGRQERLLKLIPLKANKEDFPENILKAIHVKTQIPYEEHGCIVLKKIYDDLSNTRIHLFRTMDENKGAYNKAKTDYDNKTLEFKRQLGDEKLEDYDTVLKEQGSFENDYKTKKANFNKIEQSLKETKDSMASLSDTIKDKKEQIEKLQKELESDVTELKQKAAKVIPTQEEFDQAKDLIDNVNLKREQLKNRVLLAHNSKDLTVLKRQVDKHEGDFNESKTQHKVIDDLIKNEFPKLRAKVLAPLRDKIPNFSMDEEGNILIDNKKIDELSGAESMKLALQFMSVEDKTKLMVIPLAEAFTKESLNELEFPENMDIVAVKVGENPSGNGWKSVRMVDGKAE